MLRFVGRFGSGDAMLDLGVRDIEVISTTDGVRLVAYSGANGGIVTYSVGNDSQLSMIASAAISVGYGLMAESSVTVAHVGTATYLLTGTLGSRGVVCWGSNDQGAIGRLEGAVMPSGCGPKVLIADQPDPSSPLFLLDPANGTLVAFTDSLSAPTTVSGAAGMAGATAIAQVSLGGETHLLAADADDGALRLFRYDPATGTVTERAALTAESGLYVAGMSALETVVANGVTFALLAAAGTSSITVVRLTPDGMALTDHVTDSRDTRFANLTALDVLKVDGHVFVVAGGGDDGVTLFRLMPDGQLLAIATYEDTLEAGLSNISSLQLVRNGDRLLILAGGEAESGLTVLEHSLAGLGQVLQASATASGLTGTAGADVLGTGAAGQTLSGGTGDDILIAGNDRAVLSGGAGADSFLVRAAAAMTTISDFERGLDRFDPSGWPLLRDPAQLVVTQMADGIILSFNGHSVTIRSSDGLPLTLAEVLPPSFGPGRIDPVVLVPPEGGGTPQGPPPPSSPPGPADWTTDPAWANPSTKRLVLTGTAAGDTLSGASGNDSIRALDGDDLIYAGLGRDTVFCSDGDDTVLAAGGDNIVWGGTGNDDIRARDGADRIGGGSGNDFIDGGNGANLIWGGRGDDSIFGGNDADKMGGGIGRDLLVGGSGNDSLSGVRDADTLHGGDGDDLIWGGDGDDLILGGAGNDRLAPGAGIDHVWGGPGSDSFVFYRDYGETCLRDFSLAEADRIEFARWMFDRNDLPSPADIVRLYGRLTEDGAVIDLGHLGTVVHIPGITDLDALAGAITIF